MLPRLRHDALVCGDHQQGCVDASDTCQHILNKITMARDIDKSQALSTRQRHPSETEVNRHLPIFLFLQPIRINPRQSLY